MAQINLLKQPDSDSNLWSTIPKIFARVLAVVLLLLIGYYGWLYLDSNKVDREIVRLKAKINADRETAFSAPRRDELLTRQLQLKDVADLIASHVYFSQLMPKLANVTLKKASYSSLRVGVEGQLILSVNVPSLEELDKYLQVFNVPEINQYFSDIRISSYHKVQDKISTSISFQVTMKYNPGIIVYNGSKGN